MKYLSKLDDFQKEAVRSSFRNTVVVSAPGSGKTTVILNRLNYLIKERKISDKNIIVITFTKAAAENMKARYRGIGDTNRMPFVGTFHSLYFNILKKYISIKIIEEDITYKIIKDVLIRYLEEISEETVREAINNVSVFKTSGKNIQEFTPSIDKGVFVDCLNSYEEYKANMELIDFDDLQIKFLEFLEKRRDMLEFYSKNLKHILVDEFQDCDFMQIKILKLLNKENSIFAVGDEDQCIYSFRGSRPDIMVNFDEYFMDSSKVYLSYNYRSPKNIVELSKKLISNNINRNAKDIFSSNKNNIDIKLIESEDEKWEIKNIIENIKALQREKGFSFKENAIIFRTNMEGRSLAVAMNKYKLPFQVLSRDYSYFEHFICKDIIAYLTLLMDITDRDSFLRIINRPKRYLGKLILERLKLNKYRVDCFDFVLSSRDINIFQMKNVSKLRRQIKKSEKYKPNVAISYISEKVGYLDYLREYCDSSKYDFEMCKDILEELKVMASEFEAIKDFLEYTKKCTEVTKESIYDSNKDAIILSTIHGVKGMEFDNVFILNCIEEILPHKSSLENNLEEERRLFYVAVTRTKKKLFLCVPRSIKGKCKSVSRFIGECRIEIDPRV